MFELKKRVQVKRKSQCLNQFNDGMILSDTGKFYILVPKQNLRRRR